MSDGAPAAGSPEPRKSRRRDALGKKLLTFWKLLEDSSTPDSHLPANRIKRTCLLHYRISKRLLFFHQVSRCLTSHRYNFLITMVRTGLANPAATSRQADG